MRSIKRVLFLLPTFFLGFLIFSPAVWAQVGAGEFEALRKTVEVLQRQIEIQGNEIASLKNQLMEAQAKPPIVPRQGDSDFQEQIQDIVKDFLLTEKKLTPEEKQLVTLYDDGFWLKGHDDTVRIGGWWQGDFNLYENGHPGNTRFRTRRARLDIRGILEEIFGYRLYSDFSGASASLQEAWLEYKQFPSARLKLGQFKVPFSLESSYSARWIDFVERTIGVTNLQPAEDLGVMLYGTPWSGIVDYAAGVFNGRRRLSEDNNDAMDVASRIVFAPFRKSANSLLKDFYLGSSFTTGSSQETLGGTSFTTAGGTSFFTYAAGVRHPDNRTRVGGELQWIYGPGDIKAEYVGASFNDIELSDRKTDVNAHSWYVSGSYVLTGEKKQRNKPIQPKSDFQPTKGTWGAWEIAGRYEQFFLNENPLLTGFATGTDQVDALSFGLNWWPNVHTRLMFDYAVNIFSDGVLVSGEGMDKENLFLVRTQYDF